MTRILIVDDEPQILRTLRINLQARQYGVVTAADGAEALHATARDHPDLVVGIVIHQQRGAVVHPRHADVVRFVAQDLIDPVIPVIPFDRGFRRNDDRNRPGVLVGVFGAEFHAPDHHIFGHG